MADARRPRGRGRRGGGTRREKLWMTSLNSDITIAAGAQNNFNLFSGSQWERQVTAVERATLSGIRGSISLTSDSVADGSVFMAIHKVRAGETLQDVGLIGFWQTETVLWSRTIQFNASTVQTRTIDLDIRAKRRLTDDDLVVCSIRTFVVQVKFSSLIRSLLMMGTSS